VLQGARGYVLNSMAGYYLWEKQPECPDSNASEPEGALYDETKANGATEQDTEGAIQSI
jgi:hypothetical protein